MHHTTEHSIQLISNSGFCHNVDFHVNTAHLVLGIDQHVHGKRYPSVQGEEVPSTRVLHKVFCSEWCQWPVFQKNMDICSKPYNMYVKENCIGLTVMEKVIHKLNKIFYKNDVGLPNLIKKNMQLSQIPVIIIIFLFLTNIHNACHNLAFLSITSLCSSHLVT